MLAFALLSSAAWPFGAAAVPVNATVTGEIQRITINNPADPWSGGTIDVGGTIVVIPRNLLMDLPANRLTLQQLVAEAPANCALLGETGLAKGDFCNTSGTAGIATITGNRTNAGDFVAGDVFIQKGIEAVTGVVTFIDHTDGYFCLNGPAGADCVTGVAPAITQSGVMVRLNDPVARHTVQVGLGCAAGNTANCSPDPRFTLDPDNYTNVFATGYPVCLPSTVARTFGDLLGTGTTTTQAAPDGTGDFLCPRTNRNPQPVGQTEPPVADSRRFAPIVVGDSVTAEGNFETVAGVRFLSAHSSMTAAALVTNPGQPDYFFLDEVEIDVAGYQNQRVRSLIIGFATVGPPDIVIWGVHYDPVTNAPHELPLASTLGCDLAAGAGTCGGQGLVAAGANIFKVRHDVDFLLAPPADRPRQSPCAHLRADPRFAGRNICPSADGQGLGTLAEEFAILAPMPREIQARSGNSLAFPGLVTVDVMGNQATNGQYLFPFGVGLGGVAFPEMVEINLAGLQTANIFEGLPWTLDRRLSPGGCIGPCEAAPQPLDPYPFSALDPRIQASLPQGPYNDRNFTATPLTRASNRILSYVSGTLGIFSGDATVLAWPPIDPPAQALPAPPPPVSLVCAAAPPPVPNQPPVAVADVAFTTAGVAVNIPVLANDADPDLNLLTIVSVGAALDGTVANNGLDVTYFPTASFFGADVFTYTVSDGRGGFATAAVSVTVSAPATLAPTAVAGPQQSVLSGTLVALDGSGSSDPQGLPLTFAWTQVGGPAVTLSDPALANPTFTAPTVPDGAAPEVLVFSLTVTNTAGSASAASIVAVTVNAPTLNPVAPVADAGSPQTVASSALVTLDGTASVDQNVPPLALTFTWTQIAGTPVVLNLADVHRPSFTAPVNPGPAPAVLRFQLTVTNTAALSASATVDVTVNPVLAPIAVAGHGGAVQTVLAGSTVTLHGEESSDPQGLPLTFLWTQTAGLAVVVPEPTVAHTSFTAPLLQPGQAPIALVFQLAVSNGFLSSTASTTVTVTPPGDAVTIQRVEYRTGIGRLRVDASSTSTAALMTLQPWGPGTVATPMTALGGGNFTVDLTGVPQPAGDTVLVTSSLGGFASSPITRLR